MITFLIEMLELPNFGHMITSIIELESRDKNLLVTEIMTSKPFFQNTLILRRPGIAIFAGTIKIVTIFIKTIIQGSRKVKRIINYLSKSNLYLYFLM